jgi:hypothetical protein
MGDSAGYAVFRRPFHKRIKMPPSAYRQQLSSLAFEQLIAISPNDVQVISSR